MTIGIDALLDQKCPATRLRQLSRGVTCNPNVNFI
jgi:hypothetical protein